MRANKGIFIFLALVAVLLTPIAAFSAHAQRNDKILNRPYADQKRMHLGFSVGMHFQDLKFTHNGYVTPQGEQWFAEVPGYDPGFCVNVLGDLRLHKYLNLRFTPGMYFGSKKVVIREHVSDRRETQDIKSALIVLPIDLKISGNRLGNTRPYVTLGGMASFDVSKKRTDYLWINSSDFYLTLGFGVDFYLPFFKLNPEVKFCFGLTDILRHDRPDLDDDPDRFKITQSLQKVKSNMIVLTFYFE